MLKRIITGTIYVLFIATFFLMRQVDHRLFALLIYLFSIIGTFEVARALKPYMLESNYNTLTLFGIIIVPLFCIFEYVIEKGSGGAVITVGLVLALGYGIACKRQGKNNDIVGANMLGYFYPAIPMVALLLCNDLGYDKGFIALLIPFVTSAMADSFAYFFGVTIGGKKLCPKLSPHKTWAGAFGGALGGVIGSLLIYWIFNDRINLGVNNEWLLFVVIGIVASILTIIGDLFESSIKRKTGIKDMGNILPGHGGVMDRIDGMSFVSVFVYVLFLFV